MSISQNELNCIWTESFIFSAPLDSSTQLSVWLIINNWCLRINLQKKNTHLVLLPLLATLLFSSEKDLMHGPIKLSFSGIYFESMGQNKLLEFENPRRKTQSNRDNFQNSRECAPPFLFLQFFWAPPYPVPLCAACAGIPRRLCISWIWPHDQVCVPTGICPVPGVFISPLSAVKMHSYLRCRIYMKMSAPLFRSFFLPLTSHQTSLNMSYSLYHRLPGIRVSLCLCLLNRI